MTVPKPTHRRESPRDRAEEAERLYDSPDRHEVNEAQRAIKRERKRKKDRSDPIVDGNVRKPI